MDARARPGAEAEQAPAPVANDEFENPPTGSRPQASPVAFEFLTIPIRGAIELIATLTT